MNGVSRPIYPYQAGRFYWNRRTKASDALADSLKYQAGSEYTYDVLAGMEETVKKLLEGSDGEKWPDYLYHPRDSDYFQTLDGERYLSCLARQCKRSLVVVCPEELGWASGFDICQPVPAKAAHHIAVLCRRRHGILPCSVGWLFARRQ